MAQPPQPTECVICLVNDGAPMIRFCSQDHYGCTNCVVRHHRHQLVIHTMRSSCPVCRQPIPYDMVSPLLDAIEIPTTHRTLSFYRGNTVVSLSGQFYDALDWVYQRDLYQHGSWVLLRDTGGAYDGQRGQVLGLVPDDPMSSMIQFGDRTAPIPWHDLLLESGSTYKFVVINERTNGNLEFRGTYGCGQFRYEVQIAQARTRINSNQLFSGWSAISELTSLPIFLNEHRTNQQSRRIHSIARDIHNACREWTHSFMRDSATFIQDVHAMRADEQTSAGAWFRLLRRNFSSLRWTIFSHIFHEDNLPPYRDQPFPVFLPGERFFFTSIQGIHLNESPRRISFCGE